MKMQPSLERALRHRGLLKPESRPDFACKSRLGRISLKAVLEYRPGESGGSNSQEAGNDYGGSGPAKRG
jgi:hypothetical protein